MKANRSLFPLALIAGAIALAAFVPAPLAAQATPEPVPAPETPPAAEPAPAPAATPTPEGQPAPAAAPVPEAQPAPAAPAAELAVAPANEPAYATFYRKKRMLGAALNTSVYVDKVELADMNPGEYIKVRLTPGTHTLSSDEEEDAQTLIVEPGQQYWFRIELEAGLWKGNGELVQVDPKVGENEFATWELKFAKDVRVPDMVVRDPSKKK